MKNKQQALNILAEIDRWNLEDWDAYNDSGEVTFYGHIFRARQKKIEELEKMLLTLESE